MSEKFSLNKRQIIKSLIFAVCAAIIPILIGVFNAPDFDITKVFTIHLLNDIIKTGFIAALYVIYSFFEGKKTVNTFVEEQKNTTTNQ